MYLASTILVIKLKIMCPVLVLMLLVSQLSTFVQADEKPCQNRPASVLSRKTSDVESILYGNGLLWKIEHQNAEPSYLFGTMHSEDQRVVAVPSEVKNALAKARSFSTEVIMHPAAQATYSERIKLAQGDSLGGYLDEGLYLKLSKIAQRDYELSEDALQGLKPWAVFVLLSRPKPVTGKTLDILLEEKANTLRLPTYGLETVDELIDALDSMPRSAQVAILVDTICNYSMIADQTNKLITLYLQGKVADMQVLNASSHNDEKYFNAFMERILYRRNYRIVDRLQSRLQEGGAFVAVGALHLPGERGLLNLLASRGYRVTRLY